jgi:hypothetical protein
VGSIFAKYFIETTSYSSLQWQDNEFLKLFTDSSGAYVCEVVFGKQWSCLSWPTFRSSDIIKDKTLLELIPLVLGICTWSSELKNLKLMLHIDNLALAQNINKKIKNKIKG